MPLLILSYAIQIFCCVDAIRRGASYPIILMILAFPFLGSVIYLFAVLLPDLKNSRTVHQAGRGLKKAIDPDGDIRAQARQLAVTDTVDNKLKMAEALRERGQSADAIPLYEACLEGPFEDSPRVLLPLAWALFEAGRPVDARQRLDQLIETNPDFRSQEGHLLYARSLEAEGAMGAALKEYEAVTGHFAGAEAKCRWAMLLQRLDRGADARRLYGEILDAAAIAPKRIRSLQKEWIDIARREVG